MNSCMNKVLIWDDCRLYEEAAEGLHQLSDKLPPPGNSLHSPWFIWPDRERVLYIHVSYPGVLYITYMPGLVLCFIADSVSLPGKTLLDLIFVLVY